MYSRHSLLRDHVLGITGIKHGTYKKEFVKLSEDPARFALTPGNHSRAFPLNGKEECYPRMLEEGKMGKLSHL